MCIKSLIHRWNWIGIDFLGIGIELELTFLKTKGIGIDSGIDKKELEWNLELIKRNWPQLCCACYQVRAQEFLIAGVFSK